MLICLRWLCSSFRYASLHTASAAASKTARKQYRAYIGHVPFMEVVRRHDVNVTYKPISLSDVFAKTGGLPFGKRHPARLRYRILELQRWREKRGLKFNLHPKFWPFNAEMADRFVIAVAAAGHDPDPFLRRAFAAIWEGEQNLADDATLISLADGVKLPGRELLADAKRDESKAKYEQNVKDAITSEVIGSPCYVLDGEVFWGQDRLDLVADALQSGRKPYRSDA
jgi:2-hydroxychromene-2-carboxylate isomerase